MKALFVKTAEKKSAFTQNEVQETIALSVFLASI
jgi:hypothetical protein